MDVETVASNISEYLESTLSAMEWNPCSPAAYLMGSLGASLDAGGAYGIAQGFYGYLALGKMPRVDRMMLIKGLVPPIMASVRGIYGLIVSILIVSQYEFSNYSLVKGFAHLFAGLSVGLSGWASGYCMGVVGDHGLKAVAAKPRIYINILLIVIFCEAIGLYGLIISLILVSRGGSTTCAGS